MAKKIFPSRRQCETYGADEIECQEKHRGCGKTLPKAEFSIKKYGTKGFKRNRICNACQKRKSNVRNYRTNKRRRIKARLDHPERYMARCIAANLMRKGIIVKENCLICDCYEVEKHHPDYDYPEIVMFLCREHHTDLHLNRLDEEAMEKVEAKVEEIFAHV